MTVETHAPRHCTRAGATEASLRVYPDIRSSDRAPEPKSAWRMTIEDPSGIPFVVDCRERERTKAAQEAISAYRDWRPEHPDFGTDFIITRVVELERGGA